MMPEQGYVDYLEDMLDASEKAQEFVYGMQYEDFAADYKTVFAVIRALEILGEAAKKIPQTYRDEHSELPWRSMTGMRDKLIHDYSGVNQEVVWKTVTIEIPAVEPVIRRLIGEASE